jgi:hypothetical protein
MPSERITRRGGQLSAEKHNGMIQHEKVARIAAGSIDLNLVAGLGCRKSEGAGGDFNGA